jgi:hypothetical protein
MEKLCEAPHVHADFQPARFVSRLQGILLPNTGRDGSVANFCFNSIFEFFNRIGKKATSAGPEKFDLCLSLGAGRAVQEAPRPTAAPFLEANNAPPLVDC